MTSEQINNSFRRLSGLVALAVVVLWAVAADAEVLYTITDLGVPAGPYDRTFARSVNDRGQVTGYSDVSTGAQTLGWRYNPGTGFEPLGLPPNVASGYAEGYGINNVGQVVGDTSSGGPLHAFRWSEGTGMELLPTLPGGINSHAVAINEAGQIAGTSGIGGSSFPHVVRWSADGAVEDLGVPAGSIGGFPRAINNVGQLVLTSVDALHAVRGYLYTNGSGYRELETLGGSQSEPWGINDMGQVVGSSYLPGGPPFTVHAFVWSEADGIRDIGALPGGSYALAHAINARGEIVGESEVIAGESHAFLYRDGTMLDLNDAIAPAQGWTLGFAWDISDNGLIVGLGKHNGAARSFLLRQVPEPTALVLAICAVCSVAGWRCRRRATFE